jgi:RNA polymerase sigma-70 factor (ECF subfamily)
MDADLVVRAQQGDEQAFALLAGHLYGQLQHIALRILRDTDLAKDASQQAALDMWRHLPGLRDPARFEAWAYRLLVNACKREARHQRRPASTAPPRSVDDAFGAVIDRDQLERGFRCLSVDQRTVLVLHHYGGMTVEMIAETLEIPVGTVKSRMHRALVEMREALAADSPSRTVRPQEVSE